MNPVFNLSPHQVSTSPSPDAEGEDKETRDTGKPLQSTAGWRSVSPVEVCDAASGISTEQDTRDANVMKAAGHTALSCKKTEQSANREVTVTMSATGSSEQMPSPHESNSIDKLKNRILTEFEQDNQAVGATLEWVISKLENLALAEIEEDYQTAIATLKTTIHELKGIVAGPIDKFRRTGMLKLLTIAADMKDKYQFQEAKSLLEIVAEYTEKHYDAAISSQLRQLEEDTVIHGDILNFRDKVAALSFTLGVNVHHENSPSKVFEPNKFYEKIQQLLTADEKHQKRLSPETRAFYNALEAIFEEEIPGAEIFRNSATDKSRRADKKFRMAIDKLTHENASRELPFADDILKFARNIRLIKQGRSTEATINTRKDKSSSVFKHLDDYIWCEHLKEMGNTCDIEKAIQHARQCLKDGAPFEQYLSSIKYYQLQTQLHGNIFAPF